MGWLAVGGCMALVLGCASPAVDVRRAHEAAGRAFAAAQGESSVDAEIPATLDDYLGMAFARNAGLRAAFERWRAAMEREPQARALDDPALTFEVFLEQVDTRHQIGIAQAFPALGVLRLRRDQAAAEARAAMHAFDAERFDLFERVVRAVHEYGYLARETEWTGEVLTLLATLEETAAARYRSGEGTLGDWSRAQIERERMAAQLATLRDRRAVESSGLEALLNLPAGVEPLPWPKLELLAPDTLDEASLAALLEDLNPELKASAAEIEAARQERELVRRSGWPAPTLGANAMAMPGMEGRGDETDVSLMAGISLPIWRGRVRAGVREAEAQIRAAEQERDELRNRLRNELAMAVFQFREASRRVELYRNELIPAAERALESERQDYAAGKSSVAAAIEAQRMVLEFRLLAARAEADREIALADVGCCVGAFDVPVADMREEER